MPSLFLVYELELDEPRWGGRGGKPPAVDAPIRFKASDLGCFLADNGDQACKHAAQTLGRPGKFIYMNGGSLFHEIGLGQANEVAADAFKRKVEEDRQRALDEAGRDRSP